MLLFNALLRIYPRKNIGLTLLHIGRRILPVESVIVPSFTNEEVALAPMGYPQKSPRSIIDGIARYCLLFSLIIFFSIIPEISINGSRSGTMLLYQSIRP
ncbi:MAG: hypothetical protein J6A59_07020 [Lachnospiraceae bacterium]|nr:hypothetical protein [Lachnospiraceae bacterium]